MSGETIPLKLNISKLFVVNSGNEDPTMFVSSDGKLKEVASSSGVRGEKGDTGPKGDKGEDGKNGKDGNGVEFFNSKDDAIAAAAAVVEPAAAVAAAVAAVEPAAVEPAVAAAAVAATTKTVKPKEPTHDSDTHTEITDNNKLKSGWGAWKDTKFNHVYYHNSTTNESRWKDDISGNPDIHLPKGWISKVDAQSRTYYENELTKETTWDEPKAEKQGSDVTPQSKDQQTGGFYAKYLKYKRKYLNLKNQL